MVETGKVKHLNKHNNISHRMIFKFSDPLIPIEQIQDQAPIYFKWRKAA